MTPRKASKPAARTMKRTAWFLFLRDCEHPVGVEPTKKAALEVYPMALSDDRGRLVGVTYEAPRRTKR